ncbi:MAG TPA: NepR family anti-sigma factor, partial [Stellaceae bacterium]|nr:NepR family anti-sigma factor [Stellaceae bacterium]
MKGDDVLKEPAVVKNTAKLDKGRSPGRTQLDPAAQAHIGKQLKAIYDGVVNQPVPERFLDLLQQIDAAPRRP